MMSVNYIILGFSSQRSFDRMIATWNIKFEMWSVLTHHIRVLRMDKHSKLLVFPLPNEAMLRKVNSRELDQGGVSKTQRRY